MIRIFATTYGLSEISMPYWAMGEPTGPMLKGMTYIVRPRMQPSISPRSRAFIVSGASQLFVGPASFLDREQMNVRSSTRATSRGSLRTRRELGRFAGFSQVPAPEATMAFRMRRSSSGEPLHQWISSGVVRAAISFTQALMPRWCGCAEPFSGTEVASIPMYIVLIIGWLHSR